MDNSINTKKSFSDNLRYFLQINNLTQKELSLKLYENGIKKGQSAISQWISKDYENVKMPSLDVITVISEILKCNISDLIPNLTQKPHPSFLEVEKRKFPVLGEVAAGKPIYMNEDRDCFVMADSDIDADYCLIARGDSMIEIGIKNGDLVFIKKCDMLRDGEVGVIAIEDEATLKRVRYDKLNNQIILISENQKYPPMIYTGEQLDHIHILGKAVFYQSLIK